MNKVQIIVVLKKYWLEIFSVLIISFSAASLVGLLLCFDSDYHSLATGFRDDKAKAGISTYYFYSKSTRENVMIDVSFLLLGCYLFFVSQRIEKSKS